MCLAIYAEPGARVEDEHIFNAWFSNPDGGGLAYFDDEDRLRVFKTMEYAQLADAYNEAFDKHGDSSMFLLHFRIGTSGVKDITNVHPFHLNGNTVMAHNGVLTRVKPRDKYNDTRTFVEDWLTQLPVTWLDSPELIAMVEEFLGPSNKMVVLTNHPMLKHNAYILNETQGHWDKDGEIWYSNSSYRAFPIGSGATRAHMWDAWEDEWDYTTHRAKVSTNGKKDQPALPKGESADTKSDNVIYDDAVGALDRWQEDLAIALAWGICIYCEERLEPEGSSICWECEWCLECDSSVLDDCECWTIEELRESYEDVSTPSAELLSMTEEEFAEFMSIH